MLAPSRNEIVALRGRARFVLRAEAIGLDERRHAGFKDGGVYLITDGTGGVGLSLAQQLAKHRRARLVLLDPTPPSLGKVGKLGNDGRDGPPPARPDPAKALEALGAEVLVAAADVTNLERLQEVVREAEARFGAIDGVIHAVGALRQGPLVDEQEADVEAVFAPRIHGTLALHEVFRGRRLDFLLLCSPAAVLDAAAGMVDEVAAAAFLEAFADTVRDRRVIALSFGPWDKPDIGPETLAPGITPDDGWRALERVVEACPHAGVVVRATAAPGRSVQAGAAPGDVVRAAPRVVARADKEPAAADRKPDVGARLMHLVKMHPGDGTRAQPPLFIVAGLFGNVLNLRRLAQLVGADRPVYGLQARGLFGGLEPHETFEEMARDYLGELRTIQPSGPYLLGGFSGGGITAYEMARQLLEAGETVQMVVLLDTPVLRRETLTLPDRLSIQLQNLRREGVSHLGRWAHPRSPTSAASRPARSGWARSAPGRRTTFTRRSSRRPSTGRCLGTSCGRSRCGWRSSGRSWRPPTGSRAGASSTRGATICTRTMAGAPSSRNWRFARFRATTTAWCSSPTSASWPLPSARRSSDPLFRSTPRRERLATAPHDGVRQNRMKHVLTITVTYKSAAWTARSLHALQAERARSPGIRLEAVVVDNDSGDSPELRRLIDANGWGDWVTLITAERNGGFAYGNNVAFAHAYAQARRPDFFYLLNPDAEVRPGAVQTLVDFFEANPDAGLAASSIEEANGELWPYAFRFPSLASEVESGLSFGPVTMLLRERTVRREMGDAIEQVDWFPGASMMMRREIVDDIGGMDESYFLYFEETDYLLRAKEAGWTAWYVPASRVAHAAGQSTGVTAARAPRAPAGLLVRVAAPLFCEELGLLQAAAIDVAAMAAYSLGAVKLFIQRRPGVPRFVPDLLRHSVLWPRNRAVDPVRKFEAGETGKIG